MGFAPLASRVTLGSTHTKVVQAFGSVYIRRVAFTNTVVCVGDAGIDHWSIVVSWLTWQCHNALDVNRGWKKKTMADLLTQDVALCRTRCVSTLRVVSCLEMRVAGPHGPMKGICTSHFALNFPLWRHLEAKLTLLVSSADPGKEFVQARVYRCSCCWELAPTGQLVVQGMRRPSRKKAKLTQQLCLAGSGRESKTDSRRERQRERQRVREMGREREKRESQLQSVRWFDAWHWQSKGTYMCMYTRTWFLIGQCFQKVPQVQTFSFLVNLANIRSAPGNIPSANLSSCHLAYFNTPYNSSKTQKATSVSIVPMNGNFPC